MSEDLEKIMADYLEDRLDPQAREQFEQRIKDHPELADEIRDLQNIEEGFEALGMDEFKKEVSSWEKSHAKSRSKPWKPWAITAAVLLLLVPAIYLFQKPAKTSDELFLSYYQPYEELITTRGDDDSIATPGVQYLTDGLEAYNEGSYQKCANLLSQYLELNPTEYRVALYLAIAQLELNRREQAEENFLKAQRDGSFRQQAQWYQALSYLKYSETAKALELLDNIAVQAGHYRKEQAAQLVMELSGRP